MVAADTHILLNEQLSAAYLSNFLGSEFLYL